MDEAASSRGPGICQDSRMLKSIGILLLATWAILSIGALGQYLQDSARDPNDELRVRLAMELLPWPSTPLLGARSRNGPSLPSSASSSGRSWCPSSLAGLIEGGLTDSSGLAPATDLQRDHHGEGCAAPRKEPQPNLNAPSRCEVGLFMASGALGAYGALGEDLGRFLLIAGVTGLLIGGITLLVGDRVLKFIVDWFAP